MTKLWLTLWIGFAAWGQNQPATKPVPVTKPAAAASKTPAPVVQQSAGRCSPNIVNRADGTVVFNCTEGLDPRVLKKIKDLLAEFPKTVRWLNELLARKDLELVQKDREISKWITDFRALERQCGEDDAELSREAQARLRDGDLDGAKELFDRTLLMRDEQRVDRAASNNFARGQAAALQFRIPEALPYFEKAYRYRPESFDYAAAYASAQMQMAQFPEAVRAYEAALTISRRQASNPEKVAGTLGNLAIIYASTQRIREAERAYLDALSIWRRLVVANPAYGPDVATALSNLATLYSEERRIGDADKVFQESVGIWRNLVAANPAYELGLARTLSNAGHFLYRISRTQEAEGVYLEALRIQRKWARVNPLALDPDLSATLNNLGLLYSDTQRISEAEVAYEEAIGIRRRLAKTDPANFLLLLSRTLNNLGLLQHITRRMEDSERTYQEAISIRSKLALANPAAYEQYLATTLNNLGALYRATQRMGEAEKALGESFALRAKLLEANPAVHVRDFVLVSLNLGLVELTLGKKDEACALAQNVRTLGLTPFPDWAADLDRACPAP